MRLITLLSDYGENDHYAAALKGSIYSLDQEIRIVDISHDIRKFNLAHASFVLGTVFRDFPVGTVHIACVNETQGRLLAASIEGHLFVCPDNGLLHLLSREPPEWVISFPVGNESFPARTYYTDVAVKLANGANWKEIGSPVDDIEGQLTRMVPRHVRANRQLISGSVMHVDDYGNLITNIREQTFREFHQNRSFTIKIGTEQFHEIHQQYEECSPGDCFILFNSSGLLEVGINKGNARDLLGLSYDSRIIIHFNE
jgi:S-adenosylmethionine hydrolase